MGRGAWWVAVHGVTEGRTRLSDFTFTFHCHALEKEMATHSSVLAWRIPGTGEPDGLPSMGSHRVGRDWCDLAAAAANHVTCWNTKEDNFLYFPCPGRGLKGRAPFHCHSVERIPIEITNVNSCMWYVQSISNLEIKGLWVNCLDTCSSYWMKHYFNEEGSNC